MDSSQSEGQAPVAFEQVVAMAKVAEAQSLEIEKLVADNVILNQRLGIIRAVLAALGFVVVWKTCLSFGIHTWGGGAFSAALGMLFPTVFDWRSYERTKNCKPIVGQALMIAMILVSAIIFNILIDVLRIPQ